MGVPGGSVSRACWSELSDEWNVREDLGRERSGAGESGGDPHCRAKGRWGRLRKEQTWKKQILGMSLCTGKKRMGGRVEAGGKHICLNSLGLERRATS